MKKFLIANIITTSLFMSACQSNDVQEYNKIEVISIDETVEKPQQSEVEKFLDEKVAFFKEEVYKVNYDYVPADCETCSGVIAFNIYEDEFETQFEFASEFYLESQDFRMEFLRTGVEYINDNFAKDLFKEANFNGVASVYMKASNGEDLIEFVMNTNTKKVDSVFVYEIEYDDNNSSLLKKPYSANELSEYVPVGDEAVYNEASDSDYYNYEESGNILDDSWEKYGLRYWSTSFEYDCTDRLLYTFDWEKDMFYIGESAFGYSWIIFTFEDGCAIVNNENPNPDYFFVTHEEANQWRD